MKKALLKQISNCNDVQSDESASRSDDHAIDTLIRLEVSGTIG